MATLKELRELAKAKGLKNYSKLAKDDLIAMLKENKVKVPASAKKTSAKKATPVKNATPAKKATPVKKATPAKEDGCNTITMNQLKSMSELIQARCFGQKVKGAREIDTVIESIVSYFEKYPLEKKTRSKQVTKATPKKTPSKQTPQKSEDVRNFGIDIFDFEKYSEDYELFSKHFKGIELYLRLALWISYKYGYITKKKDRKELDDEVAKKKSVKKYLESMTEAIDIEETLYGWYAHFAPEKANQETIDPILKRYIYVEDVMFNRLYQKYVDPDAKESKLWFHDPRGETRRQAK